MRRRSRGGPAGFSLAEVLVVIAVIAVLAALLIPMFSGILGASNAEVARRNLNLLNGAVTAYNQINRQITNASGASLEVVNLLKTPDPTIPGSPFFSASANAVLTSSTATYRAQWNGKTFQFVPSGAPGSGIDLLRLAGKTN